MATLYSNELKALVVPDNFLENPVNVLKENCQTVQHFDYRCEHKRNETGEIYGVTKPVILKFTIRVRSPRHFKPYYRALVSNAPQRYSFIFNATFGDNNRLSDYEDGMVVDGYVVHVEECYDTKTVQDGEDRQTLLNVTLQVRSVTYLGNEKHFKCTFVQ